MTLPGTAAPGRTGRGNGPPRAEVQLEVVQDLAGELIAERSRYGQDPHDPHDPGDAPGRHGAVPGPRRRPAQLRLGQEPQEGLRAFAVHIPSVALPRGSRAT